MRKERSRSNARHRLLFYLYLSPGCSCQEQAVIPPSKKGEEFQDSWKEAERIFLSRSFSPSLKKADRPRLSLGLMLAGVGRAATALARSTKPGVSATSAELLPPVVALPGMLCSRRAVGA